MIATGSFSPFPSSLFLFTVAVPVLTADSPTATSISLSWTSGGSEGVSYEVEWQRNTSVGCSDEDQDSTTITDGSTSYTISGLEEDSRYTITVTASNTAGSSEVSNSVTAVTEEAGKRLSLLVVLVYGDLSHSSICPSLFCDCDWCDLLHHQCPVGECAMYPSEWRHHRLLSPV